MSPFSERSPNGAEGRGEPCWKATGGRRITPEPTEEGVILGIRDDVAGARHHVRGPASEG